MEKAGRPPVLQKPDSFFEKKAGPILYIVISILSLGFLLWFANA